MSSIYSIVALYAISIALRPMDMVSVVVHPHLEITVAMVAEMEETCAMAEMRETDEMAMEIGEKHAQTAETGAGADLMGAGTCRKRTVCSAARNTNSPPL